MNKERNKKLILKFKKEKDAVKPSYTHDGDAGLDLYANENFILRPMHRAAIKTGIYLEIPRGCVGLVWDKSGIALKNGVKVIGGVVDSTYRGEIRVVVVNLNSQEFRVERGMKLAQILIQKVENVELKEVKELSKSKRGERGFGSSGLRKFYDIRKIKEEIMS